MENNSNNGNKAAVRRIKLMRLSIVSAVYIFLAAGFFYCGYILGSSGAAVAVAQPQADNMLSDSTDEAPVLASSPDYEIKTENGTLCLYERNNGEKNLIAGGEISIELFPPDDRLALEEGMVFESLAEAQAVFEDFVS